jgi:hypothetical protein
MPIQAVCDDRQGAERLTAAQVVHSTNKFGIKRAGEGGIPHVSAVFHSHPIDFNGVCCVAIF